MPTLHPLLLIRHGQAEHQVRQITGGWSDTDLTAYGAQQVRWLADRLRNELQGKPLDLGASHLRRTQQTAGILAEALGLTITTHAELVDRNNGVAAGKTHAQARDLALPMTAPLADWRPYPEAETWRELHGRVSAFMLRFTAAQTRPAILVSHFGVIDLIVSWWLHLPVDSPTHFEIAPASLTALTISKYGERAVERLNDTAHLHAHGEPTPIVQSWG